MDGEKRTPYSKIRVTSERKDQVIQGVHEGQAKRVKVSIPNHCLQL